MTSTTHSLFDSIFDNTHPELTSLHHQIKELRTVYQSDEVTPANETENFFHDQEKSFSTKSTLDESALDESALNEPILNEPILNNEQIDKFKKIYSKNKIDDNVDDNDNLTQKIKKKLNKKDTEAQFKKLQTVICCKESCLQNLIFHENAILTYQNYQNLSKIQKDMFMLGILSATIRDDLTTSGHKRLRLANFYAFEGMKICNTAFLTIYGISERYWNTIRAHFI